MDILRIQLVNADKSCINKVLDFMFQTPAIFKAMPWYIHVIGAPSIWVVIRGEGSEAGLGGTLASKSATKSFGSRVKIGSSKAVKTRLAFGCRVFLGQFWFC